MERILIQEKIICNPLDGKRMCKWTWSQTQVACILQGRTRGKGIWTKQRVAEIGSYRILRACGGAEAAASNK